MRPGECVPILLLLSGLEGKIDHKLLNIRRNIMKWMLNVLAVLALMGLTAVPGTTFAQAADTVRLYANPPSVSTGPTIDQAIFGDTTSTGQRRNPNTVYLLQQTGPIDTTYFYQKAPPLTFNVTIIGERNPITGNLPVLEPYTEPDNSSANGFLGPAKPGITVTLKNLYFIGKRTDGITQEGNVIYTNVDSITVRLDHCVFEYFHNKSNNSNVIYFTGSHNKLFMNNCEFRNVQSDNPSGPSWSYALHGNPMDTVEIVNSTLFCDDGGAFGSPGYVGYFLLDHDTFFCTNSSPFGIHQASNAVIKNNIFYCTNSEGEDSSAVAQGSYGFQGGPSVIGLDSLTSTTLPPYNVTEASRHVVVENNNYYFPKGIQEFWSEENDTATSGLTKIIPPVWMNEITTSMFSNKKAWPGLTAANNDSIDPGFNAATVNDAIDSLSMFDYLTYANGGSPRGYRYYQDPFNPLAPYVGVPSDWYSTKGYPVIEDLAYSNAALQTAGTRGFPLGDLNWFPSYLQEWEAGDSATAVTSSLPQVPSKFDLSQNYPNPFNPTTDIQVSLRQPGFMSLKIYNALGQLVDVVAQGYRQAGEYTYNVNMDKFASGVYFYTLREEGNTMTKKMLLLK